MQAYTLKQNLYNMHCNCNFLFFKHHMADPNSTVSLVKQEDLWATTHIRIHNNLKDHKTSALHAIHTVLV